MYTPKGKTHQGGYDDDEICKGMERRAWSLLAEERTEMEAAFGKGTTVVNIITGERIKL